MPVAMVQMNSQALERPVNYTALLPDPARVGPGPYAVLVQLHGYWDSHVAWLHKSNLLVYVENLPLLVVLPDGANNWWANFGRALRYEDMVVEDLRAHVEATFPVRQNSPWAIGGLSMGGFGALRIGLKHPQRYCSIFAHSSRIPHQTDDFVWNDTRWSESFQRELRSDLDCFRLAETIDPAVLPRLSFDCGTDDFLIEDNRRFHAFLEEKGVKHDYVEHSGAHTWDYWDRHVQTALKQHCEVLGTEPVARQ